MRFGLGQKPGYVHGKHFTAYVEQVRELRRRGEDDKAERLLIELVDATEEEDRANRWGVAPWYYEQLAIIYRARKDRQSEIRILKRLANQRHAAGVKPGRLLERLRKVEQTHD